MAGMVCGDTNRGRVVLNRAGVYIKAGAVKVGGTPPTSPAEANESRLEVEKERPCLRCRKMFMSSWSGHRICNRCSMIPPPVSGPKNFWKRNNEAINIHDGGL